MRTIARGYKPTRYAKRDRHGNIVDLKDRAKATKEYLEVEHWGKKEEKILTEDEKQLKKHSFTNAKTLFKRAAVNLVKQYTTQAR